MTEAKDAKSLNQVKDNKNLKEKAAKDPEEKIYVTFRKYDQYGNDIKARIDITDLVKKEYNITEKDVQKDEGACSNGLYAAAHSFVGLEYVNYDEEKNKDNHNQPINKFPVSRWEDREVYKKNVNDLVNVSLVNAKQAEAMYRLMDKTFDDFFEKTYRRFF